MHVVLSPFLDEHPPRHADHSQEEQGDTTTSGGRRSRGTRRSTNKNIARLEVAGRRGGVDDVALLHIPTVVVAGGQGGLGGTTATVVLEHETCQLLAAVGPAGEANVNV